MAHIEIEGLGHEYYNPHTREIVRALSGVDLSVQSGEFVTVVGPSGCGKSTLLYLIAGLLRPTRGRILVDGRPVRAPGADRGMVFQDVAVLPWRTVRQNIGHGLEIQGIPKRQRDEIVAYYVQLCGLKGFEEKYPHELSGGMRQRVAVARTLAVNPKVVLMDEPFAALDAQTRITLGEELLRITQQTRSTVLFVTHNVEEAVFLGDRVVVFTHRPGRVKCEFTVPVPRSQRTYEGIVHSRETEDLKRAIFEAIRAEVSQSDEDRLPRATARARGGTGRLGALARRMRHRTVLALLLCAGLAAGVRVTAEATASKRLDLVSLPSVEGLDRVEVRLVVPAEEFHVRTLQRWGVIEGIDGDRVVLGYLKPGAVWALSRLYWVARITTVQGRPQ